VLITVARRDRGAVLGVARQFSEPGLKILATQGRGASFAAKLSRGPGMPGGVPAIAALRSGPGRAPGPDERSADLERRDGRQHRGPGHNPGQPPAGIEEQAGVQRPGGQKREQEAGCRNRIRQHAERHQGMVFRTLARMTGSSDVEDLAQEVFLRLFRGLRGFRGEASSPKSCKTIRPPARYIVSRLKQIHRAGV